MRSPGGPGPGDSVLEGPVGSSAHTAQEPKFLKYLLAKRRAVHDYHLIRCSSVHSVLPFVLRD